MVFIYLTDTVQYIVHLVGPGAGAQVRRGLVAARPEVAVPGGVDALGVVGPRLVHVLHIGACTQGKTWRISVSVVVLFNFDIWSPHLKLV